MRQCMDAEQLHKNFGEIIDQLKNINSMIDKDLPCEAVLEEINKTKLALRRCGQIVLEGHIQNCLRDGLEHGDPDRTIADFTKAIERFSNL